MEENHVAFPWGATIISGGDGAKQGEGACKHKRRCREDISGPISGPR